MSKFQKSGLVKAFGAIGIFLIATPVVAHHSFAAYDMKSLKTTSGTLKEFRWGAPHSSLVLVYKDKGVDGQMSIISGSPLMFSKQGFAPRDFKRGEKIKVTYHPNANGAPGGALAALTLSNGRTFADDEAAKAAPPPK
ncbi:hypothetical protein WSK_2308 [Novosphingobium sp. Rr 2-17]|uniref:DUF6152 family protein n=1 Tax=Novosphingobium sp. Rr 2-17 TaxID=555793 RepID=UPI0002699EC9|nr:DUF6152 family protein [Novosphingobium sp. Rr 2-17]EIZ79121.1 hypothetical protein WSK_2308 [Novosphingobium sp. Rr 2-17]